MPPYLEPPTPPAEVAATPPKTDSDTSDATRQQPKSAEKGKERALDEPPSTPKKEETGLGEKRARENDEEADASEPFEKRQRGDSEFEDDDVDVTELERVASEAEVAYFSSSPAKPVSVNSSPMKPPLPAPSSASAPQYQPEWAHSEARAPFQAPSSASAQYPLEWVHSEGIHDRGSIFVGHACGIEREANVKRLIGELRRDTRWKDSDHYMYAVKLTDGRMLKDDDREQRGGDEIASVLERARVTNLLVCVSRVYGGNLLGPVRFTHISDAAKRALNALGVATHGGSSGGHQRAPPPPDAPTCKCGLVCALQTVQKEGPTKGREFFGCSKFPDPSRCNTFVWRSAAGAAGAASGGNAGPSRNQGGGSYYGLAPGSASGPPSPARPQASPRNNVQLSFTVICSGHQMPTARLISHSDKNPNRPFFRCNQTPKCDFFQWE